MRTVSLFVLTFLALLRPLGALAAPGCQSGNAVAVVDSDPGTLTHRGRALMKRLPAGTSIDVLVEVPFDEARRFVGTIGWSRPDPAEPASGQLPVSPIWSRAIPVNDPLVQDGNAWAAGQTLLSFVVPGVFSSLGREVSITLVACTKQVGAGTATPDFIVQVNAPTSAHWFCITLALVVVSLSYLAAALARKHVSKEPFAFDPIVLTAGWDGRGSPAKLQLLFFTLIVIGLLTYILSRAGLLSNLSPTVLLLLGISAVGALASRGTDISKNRLDYDNWAWLIRKGWLTINGLAGMQRPRWSDLFTIQDEFDVSRFQMIFFSLVVGVSMLQIGLTDLGTFTIPDALLGLLGLSQATYVLSKTVGPNDVVSLDKSIHELRSLEDAFVLSAGKQNDPTPLAGQTAAPPPLNLDSAKRRAEAEYKLYEGKEEEMRTMFQATYGIELKPLTPRFT